MLRVYSSAGVDVSRSIIQRARNMHGPATQFEVIDAWNTASLLDLSRVFHCIYIDIGGLSGADGIRDALALIRQMKNAFNPHLRYVVIKSRCMRDHSNQWTSHWKRECYHGRKDKPIQDGVLETFEVDEDRIEDVEEDKRD